MRYTRTPALAAVCLAAALASGCRAPTPEAPVKLPSAEAPQDRALSRSVQERLRSAKAGDLDGVNVVSSGGTVYLTGTVPSLDARQQAIRLAWTVPGVQSVVTALEVQK